MLYTAVHFTKTGSLMTAGKLLVGLAAMNERSSLDLADIPEADLSSVLSSGPISASSRAEEVMGDQISFLRGRSDGSPPNSPSPTRRRTVVVVLVNPLALHQRQEHVARSQARRDGEFAEELPAGNVDRSVGRSGFVRGDEDRGRAAVVGALAVEAETTGEVESDREVIEVRAAEGLALGDRPGDAVVDRSLAVEDGVPAAIGRSM